MGRTARQAAKTQLVSTVANIALAALPGGGDLGGAAEKALASAFGDGPAKAISDAFAWGTKGLIDQATGQLTAAGEEKLANALSSDDSGALSSSIAASNDLKNAIFGGIGEDSPGATF